MQSSEWLIYVSIYYFLSNSINLDALLEIKGVSYFADDIFIRKGQTKISAESIVDKKCQMLTKQELNLFEEIRATHLKNNSLEVAEEEKLEVKEESKVGIKYLLNYNNESKLTIYLFINIYKIYLYKTTLVD